MRPPTYCYNGFYPRPPLQQPTPLQPQPAPQLTPDPPKEGGGGGGGGEGSATPIKPTEPAAPPVKPTQAEDLFASFEDSSTQNKATSVGENFLFKH